MQKILGLLVVLGCVFGGYFEAGGQLVAIWQPAEMIIILGAGFGAMIIGNPKHVLKEIAHQIKGEKSTYALYGFPKKMLTIDAQYVDPACAGHRFAPFRATHTGTLIADAETPARAVFY